MILPDQLVRSAKRMAMDEGTTLTALIIRGLENTLKESMPPRALPVCSKASGLVEGANWLQLKEADAEPWR